MGATTFESVGQGVDLDAAFRNAHDSATYEYGHGGYSGTLAEKPGAVLFALPPGVKPREVIDQLADGGEYDDNGRTVLPAKLVEWYGHDAERIYRTYDDKWGPAVAFEYKPRHFLFCGWAST